MTTPRRTLVARLPAVLLLVVGLWLSGPLLWTSLRLRLVRGELMAVLELPAGPQTVLQRWVFRFPVDHQTQVFGEGRCDRWGRPVDEQPVTSGTAQELTGHPLPVLYDPRDPVGSARIVAQGTLDGFLRYHLGLACLLTPCVSALLHLALRLWRRRTEPTTTPMR